MRFVAPARAQLDRRVIDAPPFADLARWRDWLVDADWPEVATIDAVAAPLIERHGERPLRLLEQNPELLADGLHYEQRIAERGIIATRRCNWHDLFNALVWMLHPALKRALNARQVRDIAEVGPRTRTRAQCALTHFDEAGAVLLLRDRERIDAWSRHDWVGLFQGLDRDAFECIIVGHALLEHALDPQRLLCGKALVVQAADPAAERDDSLDAITGQIADGRLLRDPLELRPLPLMGLPGWHASAGVPGFLRSAACFQPLRAGRAYPAPLRSSAMTDRLDDG